MSETRERSGIFKFFYVLLSIITFPIFVVLFVLRHPLWILFILVLIAGGAVYWPMSQHNVAAGDVVDWYKNKYQSAKLDLAKKAIEEGKSGYVPKALLEDMKKIEEEAREAAVPKGENYNAKVVRDQKSEDLKASLKKRGGFKKKGEVKTKEEINQELVEVAEDNVDEQSSKADKTDVLAPKAEGLSSLLPDSKAIESPKEAIENEPELIIDLDLNKEDIQENINDEEAEAKANAVVDLDLSEEDVQENINDEEAEAKANLVVDLDLSEENEEQSDAASVSDEDKQSDSQVQSADDENEMDLF